jgi:hypothetical protein
MRIDPDETRAMRRHARRPWRALLAEVFSLAEGQAELVRHAERAWASATFAGTRHTIVLRFAGAVSVDAGERFIAALPEHEFAIPGQLVADATIAAVAQDMSGHPSMTVEAELVLLEDV